MTRIPLASTLVLALGLATVVATFAQCREGAAAPGGATAQEPGAQDPVAQDPMAQNPGSQDPGSQDPGSQDHGPQDPVVAPPPDAVRILISGALLGRLEPCGCASGQLGGLARRVQHIAEQRNYDLLLEGGDLVEGNSELDRLKLFTTATVLFQMERPYDALGVGLEDLAVQFDEWAAYLTGAPVVASNLTSDDPSWPGVPHRDKQVREHQVRIASLLLDELPEELRGDDARVRRTDPIAAWTAAFAGTEDDPNVVRIGMLHGRDAAIREAIPKLTPRPDLIIGVDQGYIEPDGAAAQVDGVPLVFSGIRGRVLLDARLWRADGRAHVACERVPLTGSRTVPGGGGDPAVKDVILAHRNDVAEAEVLAAMAEQSPTPNGATYVGTQVCGGCHPSAMKVWQGSKHAHAWETLEAAEKDPKRYGWPVTKYPDCVSCHVVGYGHESGFKTYADTPLLADVGCERCHGAGSKHVGNPAGNKLGILGGALKSEMCTQCHDFEQSPEFVYGERWKLIEHGREPHQQPAGRK